MTVNDERKMEKASYLPQGKRSLPTQASLLGRGVGRGNEATECEWGD